MRKITIINAYGKKNIGDAAIQESALNFLNKILNTEDIVFLLSVDAYQYEKNPDFHAKIIQHQLPYGYAIQSSSKPLSRIHKLYRLIKIITGSLAYMALMKMNKKYILKISTYGYIQSIIDSDLIIGMGGGYFTTRYGVSDNFGLLLTLLPIYIAKKCRKKIMFLPLTFGPFANETQTKITHSMLSNTTVFCRDRFSETKIEALNNNRHNVKTAYTPDLALFLSAASSRNVKKRDMYYVVTAREWLEKNSQEQYEKELCIVIQRNWDKKKLRAVFIPMAYNFIEDDDRRVAHRINARINNKNIFSIVYADSPKEVQKTLQKAQFAICTRMHSSILAFTTETPFITIAYSPKINNFLKDFGLSEWNINIEDFNADRLYTKIDKLTERENYINVIGLMRKHKLRLDQHKKEFQFALQSFIN